MKAHKLHYWDGSLRIRYKFLCQTTLPSDGLGTPNLVLILILGPRAAHQTLKFWPKFGKTKNNNWEAKKGPNLGEKSDVTDFDQSYVLGLKFNAYCKN